MKYGNRRGHRLAKLDCEYRQNGSDHSFELVSHRIIVYNVASSVREWLAVAKVRTLFIEPGSPWENGYNESSNGKLRDELWNGEIFYTLKEAQSLIEQWRHHYDTVRPHSPLGYRSPIPQTAVSKTIASRFVMPTHQELQ